MDSCTSRRSSIIDPSLPNTYTRKENFSLVHRREVRTVPGQNYWTGLSLRNLFLSPNSPLPRISIH